MCALLRFPRSVLLLNAVCLSVILLAAGIEDERHQSAAHRKGCNDTDEQHDQPIVGIATLPIEFQPWMA